ncbi:MAG TPA: flagellin [Chitinispirillaceae bacterium]|jgi:flagellin|nr:flagellin [Chitinispirillaceae bacterium]
MQVQGTGPQFAVNGRSTERVLKKTSRDLKKILERLSTARRINRASDDAAGLAIAEQLDTRIRGFKMASRNVEDSMSALNIADGAATQISSLLQRQRSLAIQARNDTLTDKDRQILDAEYQQITAEINRIATSAQFNRQGVSGGEELASGDAIIQAGPEISDQITFPEVNFGAAAQDLALTSIATSSDAGAAISAIDNVLSSVNAQRSTVGATFNRLVSAINNLSVAMVNTQAAESVLRDQDMAAGLAELTRDRLLQEGGIKAFSRFNQITQNHIMGLLG